MSARSLYEAGQIRRHDKLPGMTAGRSRDERQLMRGTSWDKWIYRCVGPVFSLLVLAGLVNPGRGGMSARIFVAGLIVVALAATWRGWRLGQIELTPDGLHAYGVLRRWHWTWAELDHVELGTGPLPFAPFTENRPLTVYTRDGAVHRLASVNGKPEAPGQPSWITLAADRINARIAVEQPSRQ